MLARFYIYIKKNHVNQILFVTELDEATTLRKSMESG